MGQLPLALAVSWKRGWPRLVSWGQSGQGDHTPRFTKNNKQNNYYTHTYSVYSAVIYCDISILELCYCIFFYFYLDIDVLFLFMSYFLIHVVHCELVEPDGI